MEKLTFDQFMQKWYMNEHPEVLDDELVDRVDDWLAEMTAEVLFEHTEAWKAYLAECKNNA